jgi:hypothetical protein
MPAAAIAAVAATGYLSAFCASDGRDGRGRCLPDRGRVCWSATREMPTPPSTYPSTGEIYPPETSPGNPQTYPVWDAPQQTKLLRQQIRGINHSPTGRLLFQIAEGVLTGLAAKHLNAKPARQRLSNLHFHNRSTGLGALIRTTNFIHLASRSFRLCTRTDFRTRFLPRHPIPLIKGSVPFLRSGNMGLSTRVVLGIVATFFFSFILSGCNSLYSLKSAISQAYLSVNCQYCTFG